MKTIVSVNQLSMYRAVLTWYLERRREGNCVSPKHKLQHFSREIDRVPYTRTVSVEFKSCCCGRFQVPRTEQHDFAQMLLLTAEGCRPVYPVESSANKSRCDVWMWEWLGAMETHSSFQVVQWNAREDEHQFFTAVRPCVTAATRSVTSWCDCGLWHSQLVQKHRCCHQACLCVCVSHVSVVSVPSASPLHLPSLTVWSYPATLTPRTSTCTVL